MTRLGRPLAAFLFWWAAAHGQEAPQFPAMSIVKVLADRGHGSIRQGSGVVVRTGIVATNAHVTAGAHSVSVVSGSQSWLVQSRKDDLHQDLSVLMVPDLPLPVCLSAGPSDPTPTIGQEVIAIGFPGSRGPKATAGLITGLWSYLGAEVLQSNAITAPGSSGGGLFNSQGRLLGLTTFIFPKSTTIHFSIPVRWIHELIENPAAHAELEAQSTDVQLPGFINLMASNPANQPAWDAFTRTWVQSAPEDPDAWFAYANSMEPSREPERIQERIAAYHRSIGLRDDSYKVWNNLGASLGLLNRFRESEEAFLKALALNPSYAMAWLNLGAVRLEARRPIESAVALRRGLELQPDSAEGWERLGEVEISLNHPAEAVRHYRTALGLSPFRAEWWADLARACDKAHDEPGLQQALARLAALDASQGKTLATELKRPAKH